jgi:prepilin-type N-terminal cleavage/methylation domain-containing protein/prepilin-type processing-associated H-X9-DG protein
MPRQSGFSLIELLVVITLMCVLASILVPVFARAQEKARQSVCLSNQQQIITAVNLYVQDHDETYPDTNVWGTLNLDPGVLTCPTAEDLQTEKTRGRNDYLFSKALAAKPHGDVKFPENEMLVADAAAAPAGKMPNLLVVPGDIDFRHNDGFIGGFCDGHVEVRKEVPPYWQIEMTNLGQWKTEVRESGYPVLVYLRDKAAALAVVEKLTTSIAKLYRGRVKTVAVDVTAYPQVPRDCGVDPDTACPAHVLMRDGKVVARVTGTLTPGPTLNDALDKRRADVLAMLKSAVGQ